MNSHDHIKNCIEQFAQGGMLIVMDDEQRENEGDLVFAAQHSTPEKINFLISHTTGIICTPLTKSRALSLGLHLMTPTNTEYHGTKFTVSCDHVSTTTGVSAQDRHNTVLALAKAAPVANQFRKPGHIFPLIAHDQGLCGRQGHTEAAVELCKSANLSPVGVIAELMNTDGTMKRYDDCVAFGKQNAIPILTIQDLMSYMGVCAHESKVVSTVYQASESVLSVDNGKGTMKCQCQIFVDASGQEHPVLLYGDWQEHKVVPVRVHSACFTGNALQSLHCDCRQQYLRALQKIEEIGYGILIYVGDHEGRGIGLTNKIRAYNLMQQGYDTVEANLQLNLPVDRRNYSVAKEIIELLKIKKINLISNNPEKIQFFKDITEQVIQVPVTSTRFNGAYLATKKNILQHTITLTTDENESVEYGKKTADESY